MFRTELKTKDGCDIKVKDEMLSVLKSLFKQVDVDSIETDDNTYNCVSDRIDNKLFGSFWAVLFKIKRNKYDVQKMFNRFDWIH